jgi:peptidoglycan/xylan/chitin deacetylase (PgdA/CDA1 family)
VVNKLVLRIFFYTVILVLAAAVALFAYLDVKSSTVVPVLMYHSIHADQDTTLFVSPEVFEKQMEFLHRYNYNVVGPDKVIAYMTKKEAMPPRTVAITVDDGFYNFYKYGYPVLKKYNFPAAIFIITDKIGKPGRLGWNELREMSGSGLITIGSHTKSHPWLPEASVDEKKLNDEIVVSKNILEKGLGKKLDYICYPNGGYNDLIKETAKKAGYKGGFTTNPTRYSAIDDIYAIRRLKMSSSSVNPITLWGKISRYYAWFKENR